jgi:hypothetical protein
LLGCLHSSLGNENGEEHDLVQTSRRSLGLLMVDEATGPALTHIIGAWCDEATTEIRIGMGLLPRVLHFVTEESEHGR